ncbi:hypothetical protein T484DRAFT_1772988 [Baffinella frigidus]|nr:hypothetical protein T484DRAFT_1772988 [Cryptophyta sp. CCMP2293]
MVPRGRHCMAALAGTLLMFGGDSEGFDVPQVALDDLVRFDVKPLSWRVLSGMPQGSAPSPRTAGGAAAMNASLFVFGGVGPDALSATDVLGDAYAVPLEGAMLGDLHRYDSAEMLWTAVADSADTQRPAARSHSGVAALGDRLWVFGGRDGGGVLLEDLRSFDPQASAWLDWTPSGVDVPSRRVRSPPAVTASGSLYVFGGEEAAGTDRNDLWAYSYNDSVGAWHDVGSSLDQTAPAPSSRHDHGLAAVGDRVFLFGGGVATSRRNGYIAGYAPLGDLWELGSSGWSEMSSLVAGAAPEGRERHGFAFSEGGIHLFGGALIHTYDPATDALFPVFLEDHLVLDPVAMSWTALAPSPPRVARNLFVALGGDVYSWGGIRLRPADGVAYLMVSASGNFGACDTDMGAVWKFDVAEGTWSNVGVRWGATVPSPRDGFAYTAANGTVWVYGGSDYPISSTFLNDLWAFSITERRWRDVTDLVVANSIAVPSCTASGVCTMTSHRDAVYLFQTIVFLAETSPDFEFDYETVILWTLDVQALRWSKVFDSEDTSAAGGLVPETRWHGGGFASAGDSLYLRTPLGFWAFNVSSRAWRDLSLDISGPAPDVERYSFTASERGDALYLYDGDSVWEFSPAAMRWRLLEMTPASGLTLYPQWDHTAVVVGEEMLVLGGEHPSWEQPPAEIIKLLRFNLTERSVAEAGRVEHKKPSARAGHGLASGGDAQLLLFGGESGGGLLSDLWSWQGGTGWVLLLEGGEGDGPDARSDAGFAASGGLLVVYGGVGERGTLDDTWTMRLSGGAFRWTRLAAQAMAPPLGRHSLAAVGDGFVVVGGNLQSGCMQRLTSALAWEVCPQTWPLPRFDHTLSTLEGRLVLFGGDASLVRDHVSEAASAGVHVLDDLWEFSLVDAGGWRRLEGIDGQSSNPGARSGHGAEV